MEAAEKALAWLHTPVRERLESKAFVDPEPDYIEVTPAEHRIVRAWMYAQTGEEPDPDPPEGYARVVFYGIPLHVRG